MNRIVLSPHGVYINGQSLDGVLTYHLENSVDIRRPRHVVIRLILEFNAEQACVKMESGTGMRHSPVVEDRSCKDGWITTRSPQGSHTTDN